MREIEFRGKVEGKWIYGGISVSNGCVTIFDVNCVVNTAYEVDDVETVGQFTGLIDINNKKIYEGDIVEFTRGIGNWTGKTITTKHVVCWDATVARFSLGEEQEAMKFRRHHNYKYDVVGNIHDNPEILNNI